MGRAKINVLSIRRKAALSDKLQRDTREIAEVRMTRAKDELVHDFEEHLVTKEIEGGPTQATNISGTLGGYGNLFSFLGFGKNESPLRPVRELFAAIRLGRLTSKEVQNSGSVIKFNYFTTVPSKEEFFEKTPMPEWQQGRSWLEGIEQGISGFTSYLSRMRGFKRGVSNSGTAIQAKNPKTKQLVKLREGSFQKTSYFSALYNNFLKKIGSGELK